MFLLNFPETATHARSFFWSEVYLIRIEYKDLPRTSSYLVQIQENTDQRKLCIWALFRQRGPLYALCALLKSITKFTWKQQCQNSVSVKVQTPLLRTIYKNIGFTDPKAKTCILPYFSQWALHKFLKLVRFRKNCWPIS